MQINNHTTGRAQEQDDDVVNEILSIEADLQQDAIVAMRNPIHGGDS